MTKVIVEIESILDLPCNTLKGDELLTDINWDSMAVVMFLAAADEKFGKALDVKAVTSAKVVSDLVGLLET